MPTPHTTPATARIVAATRAAQSLPELLEDPAAVLKVGRIVRRALDEAGAATKPGTPSSSSADREVQRPA